MTETDVTRALAGAPPGGTLPAGTVIDEWRIERHIATGGFGAVYEVSHSVHGTRGALKQLHAHLVTSPEMIARLVREAHAIARLRHPNIVELLATGTDAAGSPYLVMELLHGEDLSSAIVARGRFSGAEVLELLEPLCAAVALSHEHGIIHRDIKASNIMLCGGRVVLLDFGIAKVLDAATDLTSSRQALGTPTSMAPEQIRGEGVDARTDVYALGALAYHLLTGRRPFEDASITMSQYMHLHAARPRPSVSAPLSGAVDVVITRAMAIDPAQRQPGALAFFGALRVAVTDAVSAPAVEREAFGVLVAVAGPADADEALLDDVDRAVQVADAALLGRGFVFARDLGEAVLYVRASDDAREARAAVVAAADQIAARPGADPRVRVRLVLHRAALTTADERPVGGPLCDPAGWNLPDADEGLWVSDGGGRFVRIT